MYRAIWLNSVKRAAMAFCISRKTLDETAGFAPDAVLVLAENGHDHALRWQRCNMAASNSPLRKLAEDGDVVLTFGHRNNKRPELVIAALGTLPVKPNLIVLGADGNYRDSLEESAQAYGVADKVHFPGYVSDEEYQCLMMDADCVVLASSDEGFGLPVAEALSLGRPVVVTSDSGLETTFADSVRVAAPEHEAIGKAIADALAGRDVPSEYNAPSWTDTVVTVREAISAAIPECSIKV
ncbi:glycosyltransferase [Mycolicibacterium austroafricanum]|uniref:Glycosyltransferase n=1 Tax=Mycolicibacterium austroafricanum TaxID=39687 RepID=A0ABT8HHU3_MYCAO|nr:glycosyltransferase [Mycolicibacterium austroafricanum]MDN4520336.1 glycosyltransferase [Mycolicibacterium austroafricanum]